MGHFIPGIWAMIPEPIQNFSHPISTQQSNNSILINPVQKRFTFFRKQIVKQMRDGSWGAGTFRPFLLGSFTSGQIWTQNEIEHKICHSFVWTQTKILRTLRTQISTQRTLGKMNCLHWHKYRHKQLKLCLNSTNHTHSHQAEISLDNHDFWRV